MLAVLAPPTSPVVVAARDLPNGARLLPEDLTVARWPRSIVPDGSLSAAPTRPSSLSGPLRRGEPLTTARLDPAAGPDLDGLTRVVVGLVDPWVTQLVSPGATVDVVVPSDAGWGDLPTGRRTTVRGALVVDVLGVVADAQAGDDAAGWSSSAEGSDWFGPSPAGSALVVAVAPEQADILAALAGSGVAITIPDG
jgi:Flp pilus assembly protein CpaB